MPFWIIKAELLENYKIYIRFNDGFGGVIDFREKIMTDHRDIIRELADKNKFMALKIERHTLCWDNGVDFAPEYLYEKVKEQKMVA
jgi:hypothetical protein